MSRDPKLLPPAFYRRPTLRVARELLGQVFVHRSPDGVLSGRIVEVEAYCQEGDEAAHSHRGPTSRNAVMFEPGGVLYVYFIYGMHYCMNVVTEGGGRGDAVLVRAVEPLEGERLMQRNRGPRVGGVMLTNGPAKLCQALGIGREHNGMPLDGGTFGILRCDTVSEEDIVATARIGIRRGADLPWRFFLRNNAWVSTAGKAAG
jgi:DNA-3-methyladenine glycosylase